jgi:ABC-type bacteriocin/lantibiotic exporter with double-glycine peptidase domain
MFFKNIKFIINLKKIFFLTKDYKKKVYFLLFLTTVGSALELLSLGILIPLISYFSGNKFFFIESFFYFKNEEYIYFLLFIIFIIYFFKIIFFIYINFYKNKFYANLTANIGKELFSFYIKKNYLFHLRNSSPKLISNIDETTSTIGEVISATFNLLIDLCIIFIIIFFLLNINTAFTILLLLCLIIFSCFYYSIIKNQLNEIGKNKFIYRSLKTKFLQESFTGIREIKLLDNYNYAIAGFYNSNLRLLRVISKYITFQSFPKLLLELLIILLFVILILFLLYIKKDYSYITFLLGIFLVCAIRIIPIIGRLLSSVQTINVGIKCLDIVYDDLKEFNNLKKNKNAHIIKEEFIFQKRIKFENVNFAYSNKAGLILDGISISINKGDIIALIGDSGSGKSTLLDLLCGLLKPTSGKILIDNKNLKFYEELWQKKLSYVSQNIFLNETTVLENITFSNKNENINNTLLDQVLMVSGLNNIIKKFPLGIKTHVGEKGLKLSGGQKQRLGIARCLYKNSEVLIFDEATNALSLKNEREFLKLLIKYYKKNTIIFTSHRKETLIFCNKIYKIENKKLVELTK